MNRKSLLPLLVALLVQYPSESKWRMATSREGGSSIHAKIEASLALSSLDGRVPCRMPQCDDALLLMLSAGRSVV